MSRLPQQNDEVAKLCYAGLGICPLYHTKSLGAFLKKKKSKRLHMRVYVEYIHIQPFIAAS